MTDGAQTKGSAETKACKTCAIQIPIAARKCTHCDSFQGWRRLFGLTSNTLAMMVALVAVTTAAVPVYSQLFGRKSSLLSFAGISADEEGLSAFVSNSGDRPGLVTGAALRLGNPRMGPGATLDFVVVGDGGGAVIEPGASVLVRFAPTRIRTNGLREGDRLSSASICTASLRGQEFSGNELENVRPFPCWTAMPLLRSAESRHLRVVRGP